MNENSCSRHEVHVLFAHKKVKLLFHISFDLTMLKTSPELFEWCFRGKHAAQSDHFANAFALENIVCGYDIMMFESLQADYCTERFSVRKSIFKCFSPVFSVILVSIRNNLQE